VVAVWAVRLDRLRFLLRWVNWSGLLVIAWSLMQAVIFRELHTFPEWMQRIQALFVTTELYAARVNGFAFEPSWLAHQLNMLYLPLWLAASVRGTTVHQLRLGPLTLERFLLLGGALVLVLSVSRIGLLGFLLMIAFLLLLGAFWLVDRIEGRFLARSSLRGVKRVLARYFLRAALFLGMLVVSVAMFLGAGFGLSKFDSRMANLFDLQSLRTNSFTYYANQLVFAERIIFWEAGWQIFNQYPLLGVGPGNSGYYFADNLSAFSWHLTEVRTLMYHLNVLPNIKSLWIRLLAETGLLGFTCFATFLAMHWHSANWLRRKTGLYSTLGLAGLLMLVALLTEGFSVDTFGLPYYWISLGLVAGGCLAVSNTEKNTSEKIDRFPE
jgi:O-antigen ligase